MNYITLKPTPVHLNRILSLTIFVNYITLKLIKFMARRPPMFNHIRELHHSQTIFSHFPQNKRFNHIRELHHSQTLSAISLPFLMFNHIRELHHSQTEV